MNKTRAIISCLILTTALQAQTTYTINIDQPENEVVKGQLDLGGANPAGERIDVNNYYLEQGGKPLFPVIGEFHYSRYPAAYWEESILKMKAGGIQVIGTYVFWNIHERKEGQFDWSNDLNLRAFLQLVQKHGLYVIVRMGPFCHGEMRNGGIPDWMYGRPFEVRSNDPGYLAYVDRLYGQIALQLRGLLYKDGGPVIGVQLENEYQHSAAPWEYGYPGTKVEYTVADRDAALTHSQITVTDGKNPWSEYGKQHMKTLKAIAQKQGIDVPLYTATGWGNATIVDKGSLPVTAGYAYPFWEEPHPSVFYLFKDIKRYPDYSPVSYDPTLYPSISAEIGPGIQIKYTRRPFVPYESVKPMMIRTIGSGANGIGYYMYHGGSTPQFDGAFYNEQVNGLPRVHYDFQAPIGQYGQVRPHYKQLRMLHQFLTTWGEKLALMKTVLPETNAAIKPSNTETLRYAVRSYGESGFLFVVNYQDHLTVKPLEAVSVSVKTQEEALTFPSSGSMTVPASFSAILPFNLDLGKAMLKSATVQPLTVLHRGDANYVVFSALEGLAPELSFPATTSIHSLKQATVSKKGALKTVKGRNDQPFSFVTNGVTVLVIPQAMAENSVVIDNQLYISEALVLPDNDQLRLISQQTDNRVHVYPASKRPLKAKGAVVRVDKPLFNGFDSYTVVFEVQKPDVTFTKISANKYTVRVNSDISTLNDVFLRIDYVGDRALAFIDGTLLTDHFYHGRPWELSLRAKAAALKQQEMVLFFHPLYADYEQVKTMTALPEFEQGTLLNIRGFEVVAEYKASLTN
jgi:hypothetical protein